MRDADSDALLMLVACGGAVAPRRQLLEACGTPAAALAAGPGAWREAGLDATQLTQLRSPEAARLARAQAWLDAPAHHLIGWHDPDYPALLRRSPRPPLALFVAGDPARLWHPTVAVVGSRGPTPAGRENAARFAHTFASAGLAVGSGLAAGTDAAAHRAALDAGGLTLAVLGTGPDIAYPAGNRELHTRIAAHGALVSEYLPGTAPQKAYFPSRNRILAGLVLGVVVIEAAERSGALITARLAAEAGREVFALPGSIHNPLARGCHRLIREGAALVETEREVTDALVPLARQLAADLRGRLDAPIPVADRADSGSGHDSSSVARALWTAIGDDPVRMDELVIRTGLTPASLSSMLLAMELDGRVATQHGRYFRIR